MWAVIYNQGSEVCVDVFNGQSEEKARQYKALMEKHGYSAQIVWASDMTNVPIGA